MYVRLKSSYQLVSIPDDFLTLSSVDGDNLSFDVKYSFNHELAVKQNVSNVSVEVITEMPPSMGTVRFDGADDAKSIQTFNSKHSELLNKHRVSSVLATVKSDPTAHINNEVLPLLKRGFLASQIPQLRKTKRVSKFVNPSTNAVLRVSAQHDMGKSVNQEQRLAENIITSGKDPSAAYALNSLGLSFEESLEGTHKRSPAVFETETQKLLYQFKNTSFSKLIDQHSPGDPGVIKQQNENAERLTMVSVPTNPALLDVITPVVVPLTLTTPDRLILSITVRDSNNLIIQTSTRSFFPRDYRKYYYVPKLPPIVKISSSNNFKANLAIQQRDISAKSVRVYKKIYNHHSATDDTFTFVAEIGLEPKDGWTYLPVEVSTGNTLIYRVVPVGLFGANGSDFETVVVKPTTNTAIRRVILTTKPQLNGVLLEVSQLPADCVSFQILKEDTTIDPGNKLAVNTPIFVDQSALNQVYTAVDSSVKINHVYVYYCRVYRRYGSEFTVMASTYEHQQLVENLVETTLQDSVLTTIDDGYDVQFKIATTVTSSQVDQIKLMLEKQGMYDLFADDVAISRDKLGKLLAHNVKRTDLVTGTTEDFGVITTDEFSDKKFRAIAGVSDLKYGRKYRYVVTALLRAPETLLENFTKEKVDVLTSRTYYYKPHKFLHPLVSQRGSIVSVESLRTNHSKDPMTFGNIGNYASLEIALDKQKPLVKSATREKYGTNIEILKWNLRGSPADVDHFQIIVDDFSKKTIIGKATCVPESNGFLYVRRLEKFDMEQKVVYYIAPIYHDFTRGLEVEVSDIEKTSS